jgi:heme oxygenase
MNIREETKELHDLVEETTFALRLLNGETTDMDYVRYLNAQYVIFEAIEVFGEVYRGYKIPHSSLARCDSIVKDLETLGKIPSIFDTPKSAIRYSNYILGEDEDDTESSNSHIYLNYLGMVFGGSIIAKNIPTPGHMYKFKDRQECIRSIRDLTLNTEKVKQGFRYHIDIMEELEEMRTNASVE